ncbi:hypothetical protein G6F68_021063 [Rhizopus microsporus]|nr:hypothetical protein G6F68_021063 [Rhizopus microsporus]
MSVNPTLRAISPKVSWAVWSAAELSSTKKTGRPSTARVKSRPAAVSARRFNSAMKRVKRTRNGIARPCTSVEPSISELPTRLFIERIKRPAYPAR